MRPARATRAAAALALLAALSDGGAALAAPTPQDKALAEGLFQDGRKLMDAGKIADACPKFAESHRLDPSAGTVLNLAVCHEKEGKTASAWAEFKEAASMSAAAGTKDRAEFASKRAAALEERLSRLVLDIAAPLPGMEIKLNGKALSAEATAGSGMPVDPGEHTVEATAPGKKPWSTKISIGDGAGPTRIPIPSLEDALEAAPKPPKPTKPAGPVNPPPVTDHDDGSGLRTLGYIAGGVGLVGIGVGSVFGVMTLSKAGDVQDQCGDSDRCTKDVVDINKSAQTAATISTIAFGAGIACLGAGAVLILMNGSPDEPESGRQLWVSPEVASTGARMTVGGQW